MNSLSSVQVVVAFAVIYSFFYLVVCSRYTYLPLEMFLFEFSVIIFNMLVQQTMITGSHSLSLSVYRFVEHLHLQLAVDFVLRISNSLSFISSVNSLCSFFSRSSYWIWREKIVNKQANERTERNICSRSYSVQSSIATEQIDKTKTELK